MNVKLTKPGWVGVAALVFFLLTSGLLFKILLALVIAKIVVVIIKGEPHINDSDKLKKDKPKIPAALAEKLAKRNK